MYQSIYVPVDNSEHSNRAIDMAVELGQAFEASLTGCHVYAARMHDYRFKQMEFTLPEEYLEENELERQRKIHDSLITMGLKLISESYLDPVNHACEKVGLPFTARMMDGKHSIELIKDIATTNSDLVVLGAVGIGQTRDSNIGSVCDRVTRSTDKDVLVIKRVPSEKTEETEETDETTAVTSAADSARDTILVGIDGSPESFGALMTALEIAKKLNKKVELVAVFDPYLHYTVFNGLVGVLTEKASKVFRFEEQNQLHEEIIDTGLAKIYQSHLDVAERMCINLGFEVEKTLLAGKAFQKVLDHVRKTDPWLLIIGRVGVHKIDDEPGLGSNTDNLLRMSPCDLLITTRLENPEIDIRAEQSIRWTPQAEERFARVPPLVRGIARRALFRLALEKGHSVITNSVLDEAMDRFMPKSTARATEQLAEDIVLERTKGQNISICRSCGLAATDGNAVRCSVCDGESFEVVSAEMVEKIIADEGGVLEEAAYDGRKLSWTKEARRALATMTDAYRRRRAKARIEKDARLKRLPAISLEQVRPFIEEELGEPLVMSDSEQEIEVTGSDIGASGDQKLVARDAASVPLFSAFEWSDDGIDRLFRVPAGFMRSQTQQRVEQVATEREAKVIDLGLVEDGIAFGREMMAQMVGSYEKPAEPSLASVLNVMTNDPAPDGEHGVVPAELPDLALNEVDLMARMRLVDPRGGDRDQAGHAGDNQQPDVSTS